MKILMLTSSYPKFPGETTAPFIEEIAAGVAGRGHEVHVLAPFHPEVRRTASERGVHLHFYRYSPFAALNVWGYAQSLRADVGVNRRVLLAAPLALAAGMANLLWLTAPQLAIASRQPERRLPTANRRPPTVHQRSPRSGPFDLIHAHWVLPNAVPAALVAWLRRLPLVISLHGSDMFLAERNPPLSLSASAALRAAAQITACSHDLQDRALRLGAAPRQVCVVPYGVDPVAFQPEPAAAASIRDELGLAPGTPLLVSVSRLVYKKGLTYLLEALPLVLQQHPTATLVLAGYGDLRSELEQRANQLGIAARVCFPGVLDRERAARYIRAADIYCVPSIRDQKGNVDGLPNVLLEAMSSARPIVASCVAGIPEVIEHGVHGLLVPERNPQALASALTALLNDPLLGQRLGSAARTRVLHELTWGHTAARFEQVYQRAVG